jgi:beta propeller repeat protein
VVVDESVEDPAPRLSGDRLVWDARVGDQDEDVFYCEFDRIRQRCPVQRLTADMARQSRSAIDGDRVVWEDDRDGETRIYGTKLPRIGRMRDLRVVRGGTLVVPVRVWNTAGQAVAWQVEQAGDEPPSTAGPRIIGRPGGRALLWWRPERDHDGRQVITIAATTASGLVARRSVWVDVLAPHDFRGRSPVRAGAAPPPDRARSSDRLRD